jgi:hypothetical protein
MDHPRPEYLDYSPPASMVTGVLSKTHPILLPASRQRYGLEIELLLDTEDPEHVVEQIRSLNYWGTVFDRSVQPGPGRSDLCGVEFRSAILTRYGIFKAINELEKRIVQGIPAVETNKTTGLHVHVSDERWNTVQFEFVKKLLLAYLKFEPIFFSIVKSYGKYSPVDRVGSKYCSPLAYLDQEVIQEAEQLPDILYILFGTPRPAMSSKYGFTNKFSQNIRYCGLNVYSYFYRGTVEFRHFETPLPLSGVYNVVAIVSYFLDSVFGADLEYINELQCTMDDFTSFIKRPLYQMKKSYEELQDTTRLNLLNKTERLIDKTLNKSSSVLDNVMTSVSNDSRVVQMKTLVGQCNTSLDHWIKNSATVYAKTATLLRSINFPLTASRFERALEKLQKDDKRLIRKIIYSSSGRRYILSAVGRRGICIKDPKIVSICGINVRSFDKIQLPSQYDDISKLVVLSPSGAASPLIIYLAARILSDMLKTGKAHVERTAANNCIVINNVLSDEALQLLLILGEGFTAVGRKLLNDAFKTKAIQNSVFALTMRLLYYFNKDISFCLTNIGAVKRSLRNKKFDLEQYRTVKLDDTLFADAVIGLETL